MKPIEAVLHQSDGIITSITRNSDKGWWELEIGIPKTWVFDENAKIGCEILFENDMGKLIKISPKKKTVVIDDLIAFVDIIIETNEKIAEKEKEFTDRIQRMKDVLEKEALDFYEELDNIKSKSFKNLNDSFAKSLDKPKTPRKPRAPRTTPKKTETTTPKKTTTVTEETIDVESSKE